MRDDKAGAKQSLEIARQIGVTERDPRVDELKLKLGIRPGERSKGDESTPNEST